jgi:SAM-dependent methyltransferase
MLGQSSKPAVETDQQIARDLQIPAQIIQSEVYDPWQKLHTPFDVIYTNRGALAWLPELAPRGQTVASLLRPGGRLYIHDFHPLNNVSLEWQHPLGNVVNALAQAEGCAYRLGLL